MALKFVDSNLMIHSFYAAKIRIKINRRLKLNLDRNAAQTQSSIERFSNANNKQANFVRSLNVRQNALLE